MLSATQSAFFGDTKMSNGKGNSQNKGIGFAGISTLVSDIEGVLSNAKRQSQSASSAASAKGAQEQTKAKSPSSTQTPRQQPKPSSPPSDSSFGGWFVAFVILLAGLFFVGQVNKKNTSPTANITQSSSDRFSTQPTSQAQAPSPPRLSKPSIGRNNVLSTDEIRYCLAEKIRLDAAETVLNTYREPDVDRFNRYINDYNSRCGEYRYRPGSFDRARRDVEPYRSQLQSEGRSRFVSSQKSTPVDPKVLAVQRRLNELGYDAGAADGLFGEKTRLAIKDFQRRSGINEDGIVTQRLMEELEQSNILNDKNSIAQALTPHESEARATATPPVSALKESGRPDLSTVSAWERSSIERACDSSRLYSGPGAYYTCLKRELAAIADHSGKPDLTGVSASERSSIERTCDSSRQYSGPGAYYACLKRELAAIADHSGKPDLTGVRASERSSIERACDSSRQYSGPGAYYTCLKRELAKLHY